MLKFYGIRFNSQGLPERYNISIALRESLNASLYIYEHFENDLPKTLEAIDREINQLFQSTDATKCKSNQFRFLLAKWFRTKDISNYLFQDSYFANFKGKIAKIVNTPKPIQDKWGQIEAIMVDFLVEYDQKTRDELIHDSESVVGSLLEMVALFFLEQDEEPPPANLELQFIRNQFPKVIWKKKDGVNASSNPFWAPLNQYCKPSFLTSKLITALHGKTASKAVMLPPAVQVKANTADVLVRKPEALSLGNIMPNEVPDEITIMQSGNKNNDSALIPESISETLLSLQKNIQKQLSHEGVKHFLGILRQLSENKNRNICNFDTEEHFRLVSRISKKGTCSKKQQTIFNKVLNILSGLQVKRHWQKSQQTITNPFLLQIGEELCSAETSFTVKKLLLDPLFFPCSNNRYWLGGHLQFIPKYLFQESIHKHALLPGISSFLCGCWLNEFPQKNCTTEKTAREIIEGCSFNVVSSNKHKILDKLMDELEYMQSKKYINHCRFIKSSVGNPWEDVYQIQASTDTLKLIQNQVQLSFNQTQKLSAHV